MSIVFFIVGGILVCCSIYAIWFAHKAKGFLAVMATAESSKVEVIENGLSKSKWHKVVFSYTVDGRNYSESPYLYGRTHFSAEKQAAKYPVGSKHMVFYNPENPKQIMLMKNVSIPGMVILFFLGFGLIFLGLCFSGLLPSTFR